jgi:hypothetical protein
MIVNSISAICMKKTSLQRINYVDKKVELGSLNFHWLNQTFKLVFVASPLSMQHQRERAKTVWPGIRIMYSSGATFLSEDCYFSELAL